MDSCCVSFNPNMHVQKRPNFVENGFWGKKIKSFCKVSRTESKRMKKVAVVRSVVEAPVDEEILRFESQFFDERKVEPKTVASIILGGGAGTRLFPLTNKRAKPAVSQIFPNLGVWIIFKPIIICYHLCLLVIIT
ncbi:putative glucose-1-phosphate adenylyltransferase [Helianthus annuus]|nr:putative glucose-1-phosphate adenylyltransferase [Helianthus annuus]